MNRLWVRLALAFVVVTLVGVAIVAVLADLGAARDFDQYLARQEALAQSGIGAELAAYYQANGSWEGVEFLLGGFRGMMGRRRGPAGRGGTNLVLADENGRILYDPFPMNIGSRLDAQQQREALPLEAQGKLVGYLLATTPGTGLLTPSADPAEDFLARLRGTLVLAALIAGGLGIALGILVSRGLTAPLAKLAHAAERFAARDWNERVPVRGAQEIAEVATAFNQMADELQKQEMLRRNLIADIAHELRSPLTVMQGNLGAMLDEVYPLDRAEIATLYDETRLLARLVDDLRELALADAGKLPLQVESIDLRGVMETAAANFALAADAHAVRVQVSCPMSLTPVRADADRVAQVLRNLLANALRHTPAGGTITLDAQAQEKFVRVWVRDTGEGIAPEALPHVFDRFYRADKSRARSTASTGLGLPIAKAWVEAMGGTIGVASEWGKGSLFWFTLPTEKN